mgnify:CR=1 FL=1
MPSDLNRDKVSFTFFLLLWFIGKALQAWNNEWYEFRHTPKHQASVW